MAMKGRSCIRSKLTIKNGQDHHRFHRLIAASIFGINSPRTYTHAYSVFGLKAVIAPHVPNNIGSLSCFDLVTEAGTCVDPIRPSPVTARHVIGQMLADAVFGCLAQACPERCRRKVPAPSGSCRLNSAHGRVPAHETAKAKEFGVISIATWRHRRQTRQGRPCDHRLPLGHRRHPDRSHRRPVPAVFQAQGISDGLRRRRRMARRPFASDRDRQPRKGTFHHFGGNLRPHPKSGAGTRRRKGRPQRQRLSRQRTQAQGQGQSSGAGGRQSRPRIAGWRRLRPSPSAQRRGDQGRYRIGTWWSPEAAEHDYGFAS